MPRYSEKTDEGPLDWVPLCGRGHVQYGDALCAECHEDPGAPALCEHDWQSEDNHWHECDRHANHEPPHICSWCDKTEGAA